MASPNLKLNELVDMQLDDDGGLDDFSNRAVQMIYTLAERSGFIANDIDVQSYPDALQRENVGRIQANVGGMFVTFISGMPAQDMLDLMVASEYPDGSPSVFVDVGVTPQYTGNAPERVARTMVQIWQGVLKDYGYSPLYDADMEKEPVARYGSVFPVVAEVAFAPTVPTVSVRMLRHNVHDPLANHSPFALDPVAPAVQPNPVVGDTSRRF